MSPCVYRNQRLGYSTVRLYELISSKPTTRIQHSSAVDPRQKDTAQFGCGPKAKGVVSIDTPKDTNLSAVNQRKPNIESKTIEPQPILLLSAARCYWVSHKPWDTSKIAFVGKELGQMEIHLPLLPHSAHSPITLVCQRPLFSPSFLTIASSTQGRLIL
ncbi:hypothetical protein J6590_063292 [Homalodisca vitripennis]|nr:hypothetical protein J6590_063292 [Homalodisca vitripennis]